MIPQKVQRARSAPITRRVAEMVIILLLVAAGWTFNERIGQQASQTTAINAILAQSCGAASFEELRAQGLVEECRLAQAGALVDNLPDGDLPAPEAKPSDIDPDVVADDEDAEPADLSNTPLGPSDAQVEGVVRAYFRENPLSVTPGYTRALQRAVSTYLTTNPPERGRPPTAGEVRDAVRVTLLANPPRAGADGRGVADVRLSGCEVVLTYTDGTVGSLGPVCGPAGIPGPPPSDEQVARAVVAYCDANGACRGPKGDTGTQGPPGTPGVVRTSDSCNPAAGEYVTDVNIQGPSGDPATITITCTTAAIPGLIPEPPAPTGEPTAQPDPSTQE